MTEVSGVIEATGVTRVTRINGITGVARITRVTGVTTVTRITGVTRVTWVTGVSRVEPLYESAEAPVSPGPLELLGHSGCMSHRGHAVTRVTRRTVIATSTKDANATTTPHSRMHVSVCPSVCLSLSLSFVRRCVYLSLCVCVFRNLSLSAPMSLQVPHDLLHKVLCTSRSVHKNSRPLETPDGELFVHRSDWCSKTVRAPFCVSVCFFVCLFLRVCLCVFSFLLVLCLCLVLCLSFVLASVLSVVFVSLAQ